MSEPAEKSENIPDASAGKGIPNGGNAAKTQEVRTQTITQTQKLQHTHSWSCSACIMCFCSFYFYVGVQQ